MKTFVALYRTASGVTKLSSEKGQNADGTISWTPFVQANLISIWEVPSFGDYLNTLREVALGRSRYYPTI